MAVEGYRDLVGWQKGMDLVVEIYRLSAKFPKQEVYGLTSQIRRAAVSIPSNIAEGHDKATRGEFIQFLGHAKGSLAEVETQVIIAQRLEFLSAAEAEGLVARVRELRRIVSGLLNALKKRSSLPPPPSPLPPP